MTRVVHCPGECREALARASHPIVLDLETTGLERWDQIVSAGLLVDGVAYILFVRSRHVSIDNIPLEEFRAALRPLERPELTIIAHNAAFDLAFLRREGIRVTGPVRDTLKILKLLDQDRGRENKGQDAHPPRRDLRAPENAPFLLDYRLKHVAAQLLGLRMLQFPGAIQLAPYAIHARYLACDLVGTQRLHDFLWPRLTDAERSYFEQFVAPLTPLLLDLEELGVAGDPGFIRAECERLEELMEEISAAHQRRHGVLLGMDHAHMSRWLFGQLRLPVLKHHRRGKRWIPSLDGEALQRLTVYNEDPKVADSLRAIQDYRQAASLLVRLRSLLRYVDPRTNRIHSSFEDRQTSGRISSRYPNLQQLAREKAIAGQTFLSRNALRASDGFELVAFDIAQADIRVLAHAVESFPRTTERHKEALRQGRWELLADQIAELFRGKERYRNPTFSGERVAYPEFFPPMPADLAADFAPGAGDFYTKVAERILGRPIQPEERKRFKTITLGIVNGKGPPSLAKDLSCTEEQAQELLHVFDRAYPKVAAYKWAMNWQIALTGRTATFLGRPRTVTVHRWLVTEPHVEILVSYRKSDAYWAEIVPLEPSFRVLTSYVRKVWNARTGKLIYDHQRGRLSPKPYRLFDRANLQYFLPYRNWSWRSIRRVRARGEEARYEGFEATARSAFNCICQGGTADISKVMMLRSLPVCVQFGARLLIQIHDELVFEVPKDRTDSFLLAMHAVLEQPPVPNFAVPIVVEPKRGFHFGAMKKVTR